MRVKRYIVDSMPAALQRIRSELGNNAVILNTKEVRHGGVFGFFGKKKIEVIAAIETPSHSNPRVNAAQELNPSPPKNVKSTNAATESAASEEQVLSKPDVRESEKSLIPPSPLSLEDKVLALRPKSVSKNESQLLNEIQSMKSMMQKMALSQDQEKHPEIETLRSRLLKQGISSDIVQHIITSSLEQIEQFEPEAFRTSVHGQVVQILQADTDKNFKTIASSTKIVHIIGPTGVGKTTTIAKLAAEQVLKNQKQVGLITLDTYRIAAVEQLKTYAEILNAPLEVVSSPQDLKKAFDKLSECDLIFMDTAGRNYRNEMLVSELNAFLKNNEACETYLVLSLTAKYSDMKVITENFLRFSLDKVLFTKMDETDSYGSVVNLAYDFNLPLSYVTHGQNVPEDISTLNEHQLTDLIVGVETDE